MKAQDCNRNALITMILDRSGIKLKRERAYFRTLEMCVVASKITGQKQTYSDDIFSRVLKEKWVDQSKVPYQCSKENLVVIYNAIVAKEEEIEEIARVEEVARLEAQDCEETLSVSGLPENWETKMKKMIEDNKITNIIFTKESVLIDFSELIEGDCYEMI